MRETDSEDRQTLTADPPNGGVGGLKAETVFCDTRLYGRNAYPS